MSLPWDQAIALGICTQTEADTFRDCVERIGDFAWRMDSSELDESQFDRLCTVISWMTSEGGVH